MVCGLFGVPRGTSRTRGVCHLPSLAVRPRRVPTPVQVLSTVVPAGVLQHGVPRGTSGLSGAYDSGIPRICQHAVSTFQVEHWSFRSAQAHHCDPRPPLHTHALHGPSPPAAHPPGRNRVGPIPYRAPMFHVEHALRLPAPVATIPRRYQPTAPSSPPAGGKGKGTACSPLHVPAMTPPGLTPRRFSGTPVPRGTHPNAVNFSDAEEPPYFVRRSTTLRADRQPRPRVPRGTPPDHRRPTQARCRALAVW